MSIRTNPMKAVPTLLKRLVTVDRQANLKDLKNELIGIKDLFSLVKKNEQELLDTLAMVDDYLLNNMPKLMKEEKNICAKISESTKRLLPLDQIQAAGSPKIPGQDLKSRDTSLPSTTESEELKVINEHHESLDSLEKQCLLHLLHLPENSVMKKRSIVLWWAEMGLVAKENGEDVFEKFRDHKLIVPHDEYAFVNKFKINPLVHLSYKSGGLLLTNEKSSEIYSQTGSSHHRYTRDEYLPLIKQKVELSDETQFKSDHVTSIFNIGASYLTFEPKWMAKMKHLRVLQLGRWLHASPKHHIEVNSEEFLKELRDQKDFTYLSLRGISRISELPDSIFQLQSLETIDLKACHNLETLPDDIASLTNLKHLNLSQCYLLDRMPRGVEKLTKLEVLKGFVIGSSDKTPSKISDLANLSKLKQLSIHIGRGAMIRDMAFESLHKVSGLEKLKIS